VARPAVAGAGRPGGDAKEVARVRLNVTLYRVMAYVTGAVLIVLCGFAIGQAFTSDAGIVNVIGTVHGLLYIVYLIVSYPLTRRLRLPLWPTVAVLLAGTIPVMTFVVERRISHRYIEPALAGVTARLPRGHASFSLRRRP
jgi:integral membrane protein